MSGNNIASLSFSVNQIAELLAVSPRTVVSWIRAGELRAFNASRRAGSRKPRWRVTQAALEDFQQSRTPTPPAPRTRRKRASANGVIEFYR